MIVDREDRQDIEPSQRSLRIQLLAFMRWPFLLSMAVLIAIALLGHLYAFQDGETVLVPAIVIGSCYVAWVVYAIAIAPRFVKKWCRTVAVPPDKRVRFYASCWTDHAIEFDAKMRNVMMVAVPTVMVIWRSQRWYVALPMLLPMLLYISDAVLHWRKLSL